MGTFGSPFFVNIQCMERKFGFNPFSLVDSPNGTSSSVVYTLGCNLRCPYCYNDSLVLPEKFYKNDKMYTLDEVKGLISARKRSTFNLSDYIVISGGEPLLHYDDVLDMARHVKSLGMKVKINTNGTQPLWRLLVSGDVDYLSLDLKLPFHLLPEAQAAFMSAKAALDEGIIEGCEVHTVLIRYNDLETMLTMASDLASTGFTGRWYLAGFKFTDTIIGGHVLSPESRLNEDEAEEVLLQVKKVYDNVSLIGY